MKLRFLPLALLLILADALITRMGWRMPQLALARRVREKRTPVPKPVIVPSPAVVAEEAPGPVTAEEDPGAARRRIRFARAKKR